MISNKKNNGLRRTSTTALAVVLGVTLGVTFKTTEVLADTTEKHSYDSIYRAGEKSISEIVVNGGQYLNSSLKKYLFDGDTKTHWETARKNNDNFTNTITVKFDEEETLSSIVFVPRLNGAAGKGYPTSYTVYASMKEEGEDFEEVKSGESTRSNNALTIKLDKPTKFKRLRFEFKEASEGWAACSELYFYRQDILMEQTEGLFTDGTMTKLKSGVNENQLNEMLDASKSHPYKYISERIELAKEILKGANYDKDVFEIEQDGNGVFHAINVLKTSSYGANYIPTGIAAKTGDTIKVYVEAEEGKPLPQIVFTQQYGSWQGWTSVRNLEIGENVFTVPAIRNNTNGGGAIYLLNPYTPQEQGKAPKVRILGGHDYPLFKDKDNVDTFMKELTDYKIKLQENPNKYVDIVELYSDYVLMNSNMKSANIFFKDGFNPQKTLDFQNDRLAKFLEFAGIYEKGESNNIRGGVRANFRLMQPYGFAYAASDHTGFQQGSINTLFEGRLYGWAIAHEIGHHLDIKGGCIPEVTNNMWSNYNIVNLQGESDKINSSLGTIFTNLSHDDHKELYKAKSASDLAVWWQLHLLNGNYWPNYQKAYRNDIYADKGLSKNERMVAISCYALNTDVTEHFYRYKFIDDNSVARVKEVLKEDNIQVNPNLKPWYMWDKATKDTTSKFNGAYVPEILSIKQAGNKIEVKIDINESQDKALLGYEIIKDDKVIGFTKGDTFTITESNLNVYSTYKVRAFDLRSNATDYSQPITVNVSKGNYVKDVEKLSVINGIGVLNSSVENAFNVTKAKVEQIDAIVVTNNNIDQFSGNDVEEEIVKKIKEFIGDIPGNYCIYINNYEKTAKSVDELLKNNMIVTFQYTDGSYVYTLKNGVVEGLN